MISREFAENIHKCGLVYYSEELELLFVWNSSATVNIFTMDGRCVDCFTLGDTDRLGRARRDTALESIESHIESHIESIMKGEF